MVERIATIVLLVEDRNQENVLRRYLQERGHSNRNMRVQKLADGQGSGEQFFVREKYASEVRLIRSQATRTKACLIAMIDADTGSVEERRQQIERALKDADEGPRGTAEPILNLIPRRNVETWILCLEGVPVDEQTNYRHDPRVDGDSIKRAAKNLFDWALTNTSVPKICVTSLLDCLPEFGYNTGPLLKLQGSAIECGRDPVARRAALART